MIAQDGIYRYISECLVNVRINLVKALDVSLKGGLPTAMVYYIAGEINVGDILRIL